MQTEKCPDTIAWTADPSPGPDVWDTPEPPSGKKVRQPADAAVARRAGRDPHLRAWSFPGSQARNGFHHWDRHPNRDVHRTHTTSSSREHENEGRPSARSAASAAAADDGTVVVVAVGAHGGMALGIRHITCGELGSQQKIERRFTPAYPHERPETPSVKLGPLKTTLRRQEQMLTDTPPRDASGGTSVDQRGLDPALTPMLANSYLPKAERRLSRLGAFHMIARSSGPWLARPTPSNPLPPPPCDNPPELRYPGDDRMLMNYINRTMSDGWVRS